jgi:hypothetical protein
MDQIKLGIFDLERQDRERERFAHERGGILCRIMQIFILLIKKRMENLKLIRGKYAKRRHEIEAKKRAALMMEQYEEQFENENPK